MQPSPIVITGMHRSGTSFVASLLAAAGVDIGERLMPGGKGNPLGHFENLDFVEFQRRILQANGYDEAGWTAAGAVSVPDDLAADALAIVASNVRQPNWGWKDPRTSLLLDFWAKVCPNAYFVLLYREPAEVINSLFRRGDPAIVASPDLALRAWLVYNAEILRFARMHRARSVLANISVVARDPGRFLTLAADKFDKDLQADVPTTFDPTIFTQLGGDGFEAVFLRYLAPSAERLFIDLEGEADLAAGVYRESTSSRRMRNVFFERWLADAELVSNAAGHLAVQTGPHDGPLLDTLDESAMIAQEIASELLRLQESTAKGRAQILALAELPDA